jgi:hypothetical protein
MINLAVKIIIIIIILLFQQLKIINISLKTLIIFFVLSELFIADYEKENFNILNIFIKTTILFCILIIVLSTNDNIENLTNLSNESLQNFSAVYNSGTANLTNLNITGTLTVGNTIIGQNGINPNGNLIVGNIQTSGINSSGDITTSGTVTTTNLLAKGSGTINGDLNIPNGTVTSTNAKIQNQLNLPTGWNFTSDGADIYLNSPRGGQAGTTRFAFHDKSGTSGCNAREPYISIFNPYGSSYRFDGVGPWNGKC